MGEGEGEGAGVAVEGEDGDGAGFGISVHFVVDCPWLSPSVVSRSRLKSKDGLKAAPVPGPASPASRKITI